MRTLLLTGFGPFEVHSNNPSGEIARALDGLEGEGFRVHGRVIDVSWERAFPQLRRAVLETRPDVLIELGLAAEARSIRLEQLAKNAGSPRADIDGVVPVLGPRLELIEHAPAAYFSTLPPLDLPGCERSTDAGSYLCNYLFYRARHELEVPAIGFVHVPRRVEQRSVHEVIDAVMRSMCT